MSEKRPRGRPRKPKPEPAPEPAPVPDVIQVAANRSTQIKKVLGIVTAVAGVVAAGATAYSKIEKARGGRLDEERANLLISRQREVEARAELARARMENSRVQTTGNVLPHLVKAGVVALTYAATKPTPEPPTAFQKGERKTHEKVGEYAGYFTVIPEAGESIYKTGETLYSYIPKGVDKPAPPAPPASKKSAERAMRDYYMQETKQPAYLRSTVQKVAGRHVPDYSQLTIGYDPETQIPANKTSMWESIRKTLGWVNDEFSVKYA